MHGREREGGIIGSRNFDVYETTKRNGDVEGLRLQGGRPHPRERTLQKVTRLSKIEMASRKTPVTA